MGRRIGTKRNDRRWEDENGEWASKFEATVFAGLRQDDRIRVRRCSAEQGDSFSYCTKVTRGEGLSCASTEVVQRRIYTPDLFVVPASAKDDGRGYYLEVKGYLDGTTRSLLRSFLKTGPGIDLRIVFTIGGANKRATSRLTMWEYVDQYMKIPWGRWPHLPEEWYE